MIELQREELACAGFRRANDDWDTRLWFPDAGDLAKALPARRRERKPSLASQLKQVWKAAKDAGVSVVVTIEGVGKVTAQPARAADLPPDILGAGEMNEWDRDLGTHPPEVRQ